MDLRILIFDALKKVAAKVTDRPLAPEEIEKISEVIYKSISDSSDDYTPLSDYEIFSYSKAKVERILSLLSLYGLFYSDASKDIYEYLQSCKDINMVFSEVKSSSPNELEIRIAFRMCKFLYFRQECGHDLKWVEYMDILTKPLKEHSQKLLQRAISNYEIYWDDVLNRYVRKNARINRLRYLIEKLESFSKHPDITPHDNCVRMILQLRDKYTKQLEQ